MHRRHRRDATQSPAVAELIAMGFSVADTSQCGDDFPDLVIGKHGLTGLVELKAKSPGRTTMNKLVSAGQREFAAMIDDVPGFAHKLLSGLAHRLREYDVKSWE